MEGIAVAQDFAAFPLMAKPIDDVPSNYEIKNEQELLSEIGRPKGFPWSQRIDFKVVRPNVGRMLKGIILNPTKRETQVAALIVLEQMKEVRGYEAARFVMPHSSTLVEPEHREERELEAVQETRWELRLSDGIEHPFNYPPIEVFSAEDRAQMQQDIAVALSSALLTEDWANFEKTLYAWQATAEVLSDPELTAELLADDDPTNEVPLRRP